METKQTASGQKRPVNGLNARKPLAPVPAEAPGREAGNNKPPDWNSEPPSTEGMCRTLFENDHTAMLLIDPVTRRIVDANPAAAAFYGWSRKTLQTMRIDEIYTLSVKEVKAEIGNALAKTNTFLEFRHRRAGGEIRDVQVHSGPIKSQGEPLLYSIIHDMTEEKTLTRQLIRAQRLESIGALAGGVSHDLNNILSPILMAVDLLERNATEKNTLRLLSTIRTSARRGAEMVKQILHFSRGAGGQAVAVDLPRILREVRAIVSGTFPKEIAFSIPCEPLPWIVEGDATQLYQVLLNLCVNARDAMPDGGKLTLSVDVPDFCAGDESKPGELDPGTYVRIDVRDTGHGIEEELQKCVFDPFFTTKPEGVGTGLGLAISQRIVKGHKGAIVVESTPGRGSLFRVFLPAKPIPAAKTPATSAPLPKATGRRVLVVDDEASIREMVRRALEAFDYSVSVAKDGAEAVEAFAASPAKFDAALIDLRMPVMGGKETVGILREFKRHLPVILMSGEPVGNSALSDMGLSDCAVITKPFSVDTLLRALARCRAEADSRNPR